MGGQAKEVPYCKSLCNEGIRLCGNARIPTTNPFVHVEAPVNEMKKRIVKG